MTYLKQIRQTWNPEQLASNAGVMFGVRFVATVLITNSKHNKSAELDQKKTIDCINVACEKCHLKHSVKKKKENLTVISEGLLMDAKLKITDESLTICEFDTTDKSIAESDICKIQYVSIGDSSTLDFIGYVVSNTPQHAVCHVVQCLGGTAFEVLSTITQGIQMHTSPQTQMRAKAIRNLPRRSSLPCTTSLYSYRSGCSCCDSISRSSYWSFLPEFVFDEENIYEETPVRIEDDDEKDNENIYELSTEDSKETSEEGNDGTQVRDSTCMRDEGDSSASSTYSKKSDRKSSCEEVPVENSPLSTMQNHLTSVIRNLPSVKEEKAVTPPLQEDLPAVPPLRLETKPQNSPPCLAPKPAYANSSGLFGEQWYVGEMERLDAESRLKCLGEFLVRVSQRHYVLSVRCDTTWMHSQLVELDKQNFIFRGRQYTSVTECVNYLYDQKQPITSGKHTATLLIPYKKPSG